MVCGVFGAKRGKVPWPRDSVPAGGYPVQLTGHSLSFPPAFPEHVELEPLPHWQPVGENLTLHCQVKGGRPQTHLSVMLLRGEELLIQQPAVGEPAKVMTTVLAGRDDHGTNFSCRTELNLQSQGLGLFQNSSVPRQLRTFGEALGNLQEDRLRRYFHLGCGVPGKEGLLTMRVLRR